MCSCEPTAVVLPAEERPVSVHCGADCTAVVTTKSLVYVCGRNTHNKLGISYSMFQSIGIQVRNGTRPAQVVMGGRGHFGEPSRRVWILAVNRSRN